MKAQLIKLITFIDIAQNNKYTIVQFYNWSEQVFIEIRRDEITSVYVVVFLSYNDVFVVHDGVFMHLLSDK